MKKNTEILKDLLLEDYRYRAEAMKNSEQTGETRINIFVGFATLLLGALVSLSTQEQGPKGATLKLILLAMILVLVVLGWLTLLRLIIRNKHTDECKRDLDHIRQTFKDHFDDDGLLNALSSQRSCPCQRNTAASGTHDECLNSLLVAGFVGCLLLFQGVFS
jgi:hypothetical protein